jgi:hypothetical protein
MANRELITAARVRELFHYDPETGVLLNRCFRGPAALAGAEAGSVWADGYRHVQIDKERYAASHIIWLWMTGEWPNDEVDHRSGDRDNNRWKNLRQATVYQNQANRKKYDRNKCGLKWVCFEPSRNMWKWSVVALGIRMQGRLNCPAAAHFAALIVADTLHGEFMRHE